VSIRNTATGVTRETTTDATGLYRPPPAPIGPYEVTASLAGFSTTKRPNLSLSIGQTLTVDVSMQVSGAQEEVTVTAEAPLIEPARTHQATTVGAVAVANLPVNGRNFIDFVLTTPGVSRDVARRRHQLRGPARHAQQPGHRRGRQQQHLLRPDPGPHRLGRGALQFSQDAVQEFQVNRNAYSAEYGAGRGRGHQRVHQVGHQRVPRLGLRVLPRQALNANSYANKIVNPSGPRAPFRINQFGGLLGGPLQKDKAFFFLSYDGTAPDHPQPG
jgi:hypothetical protein